MSKIWMSLRERRRDGIVVRSGVEFRDSKLERERGNILSLFLLEVQAQKESEEEEVENSWLKLVIMLRKQAIPVL